MTASKTFCALPFWHIDVNADGTAQLCCRATERTHGRWLRSPSILHGLEHLSFLMLPQAIVGEALAGWRAYRDSPKRPRAQRFMHAEYDRDEEIAVVMAALGRSRPANIDALQDRFVRFTHDLDASRDQSLAAASPRLFQTLRAAGITFEGTRRRVVQ